RRRRSARSRRQKSCCPTTRPSPDGLFASRSSVLNSGPMRHRYSYLDPDLIRQLLAEMGLRRLFNHLLLQTGGDVEEAMRWMRALQERGYIDPNVDLEAFFARLLEENIIAQDEKSGRVVLAAGGERQIRRDALDEIFGGLQQSMT